MEIDGDQVENLLSHGDYKTENPILVPILPNRKALVYGDQFGRRIRANIIAPSDGEYRLALFG